MYDSRKSLSRETSDELEKFFQEKLFRTKIRTNVRLAEAPSHGKTVFDYAPDSNGSRDYRSLSREVVGLPLEILAPPPVVEEALPAGPQPVPEPGLEPTKPDLEPTEPATVRPAVEL